MTRLAEAALTLARRGNRVFPVGNDKAPRVAGGFHAASSDPEVVGAWPWLGGIGLVVPDRVLVLDVDPRNGGDKTMAALRGPLWYVEHTRTVRTQSGGRHLYYALPDDRDLRSSLGPGVDVRKPGRGYVLVPPSPGYSFLIGGSPKAAPEWLLDEATVQRRPDGAAASPKFFPFEDGTTYGRAALRLEIEVMVNTGEGGRRAQLNTSAFKLASLVAAGELDEDKTCEALLGAALDTGLDEGAALSRIKSGWFAGLRHPRGAA